MVPRDASAKPVSARGAFACASAATLLAVLGFLGWLTPWRALASLGSEPIPMAPSTALAIGLLGGTLMLDARRPSPRFSMLVSLGVLALASAHLVMFAQGLPPALDVLLVREPEMFGSFPTGRMRAWTALGLVLASVSLLLASASLLLIRLAHRHRALAIAGGIVALGQLLLGSLVTLGYLFGAPLLYGSPDVPMALPTGLAVSSLALAALGLSPRDGTPLRPFLGDSARARLLRAFLPLAPAIVAVELFFHRVPDVNPALRAALTALLSALAVIAIVSYVAHGIGSALERAQAEAAHSRLDADRLAAIVRSSSEAIYAKDLDGTIVVWNASAERLFGHSAAAALGRPADALALPDAARDRGKNELHETSFLRPDGTAVHVSVSESLVRDGDGNVTGVSITARDVSALRASEEHYRTTLQGIEAGVVVHGADARITAFNAKAIELLGVSAAQMAGRAPGDALWGRVHADGSAVDEAELPYRRALESRLPVRNVILGVPHATDGERRWLLVNANPVLTAQGDVAEVIVTFMDATAQIRAEIEMSNSQQHFARIFESSLVAIGIAEVSGRFIDVNERCAQFFGYQREEMIGRTVFELGIWVDPVERARHVAGMSASGPPTGVEAAFRRKSGEIRHALVSMEAVRLAGIEEPLHMVALVDITERRQLEAQLRHAQKMDAVGRLAGGVAHDFNNALGVILGYTELLLIRGPSDAERSQLEEILKATQHAAGLTRQLLAFSRKQIVDPRVLDLNALLADVEKILGRLIGEDIDLVIVADAALGQVEADVGQLQQVMLNLCANARDAMPDGGLLRIETANTEVGAGFAEQEPMVPGPYVMLTVSDTGGGMDKDTLAQIFEPFFTTKGTGQGTGLGLATTYGIVKRAGGYIWASSEPGRGTTFRVYLPRVEKPVSAPSVEATPTLTEGWETILVVEDEASLRTITSEILGEHGYRVLEAASAGEALRLASKYAPPIDLLLTDVVMPGGNGRELAESLRAVRPEIKVLYMSGYTDEVIAQRGVLESGTLLLEKPFTALALLGRVRLALGDPASD